MNRDFKGIWIPREIWVSKELSMQEKVFLAEIHSLDNELGCIASNAYFAEFFQLSKSSVSRIISSLVSKEMCSVMLTYKSNKEVDKRIIRCSKYGEKEIKVISAAKPSVQESKPLATAFHNSVLKYLNEKSNKRFKAVPSFTKLITARFNEKHSYEDFKHVIDVKCSQWLDTDFDKFLRPSTLFSASKFPEYLSEKFIATKKDVIEKVANSQKGFYDV
jgi:uncharacterized phage protein (TIGR02220 family)|tara:strand:+ start:3284 stop:3937 length:654 start_codon:yes stop_codon:yes gene_type:complete